MPAGAARGLAAGLGAAGDIGCAGGSIGGEASGGMAGSASAVSAASLHASGQACEKGSTGGYLACPTMVRMLAGSNRVACACMHAFHN